MGTLGNLLIDEAPLMVLPSLAKAIGINEALLLQQVHFWLQRSRHIHDGRTWMYNTIEGWRKQLPFWSAKTITRTIKKLERDGYLIATTKYNSKGFDQTKWYTIDYDLLNELSMNLLEAKRQEVQSAIRESLGEEVGVPSNGTNCPNETPQGFEGVFSQESEGTEVPQMDSSKPRQEENAPEAAAFEPENTETAANPDENGENLPDFLPQEEDCVKVAVPSIRTKCPNEENQGFPPIFLPSSGQNDRSSRTDCPVPLGQIVQMQSDNLSRPIPYNNNKRISQRTTTYTQAPVDNPGRPVQLALGETGVVVPQESSDSLRDRLIAKTEKLGIRSSLIEKLERKYGSKEVEYKLLLLEKAMKKAKAIANPAGWLVTALEQGYVDSEEDYACCREEHRQLMRQKNEALCARMREETLREVQDGLELPADSPFSRFLHRKPAV